MKSDEDLGKDVESELQCDPNIDAADVAVAVKDGVVTLTGLVRNFNQKWDAAVMRFAGTHGVANDLEVNLPAIRQRSNPEIARDVVSAHEKVLFAILQVGGFLGVGGRLVGIPYNALDVDDDGSKNVLAKGCKEELGKLPGFKYSR